MKEQLNRFASRFHWRKIYERNKRVSISSRFHGVNLGCGTEQRRERIATELRQSWNPRRDRKIRIVGSSRLVKHSAHASTGRGPIPARSSVKIARSITNQPDQERKKSRKKEKEKADARDPKEQGRWISLVSSPALRIPDRKLTRINACPLCRVGRWRMDVVEDDSTLRHKIRLIVFSR